MTQTLVEALPLCLEDFIEHTQYYDFSASVRSSSATTATCSTENQALADHDIAFSSSALARTSIQNPVPTVQRYKQLDISTSAMKVSRAPRPSTPETDSTSLTSTRPGTCFVQCAVCFPNYVQCDQEFLNHTEPISTVKGLFVHSVWKYSYQLFSRLTKQVTCMKCLCLMENWTRY